MRFSIDKNGRNSQKAIEVSFSKPQVTDIIAGSGTIS